MRVDAHHHFWDLAVRDQPWMDGAWADPLRRRFGPEDLAPLLAESGFDASVVVQTVSSEAETRGLLSLADSSPSLAGVVGWVDLTAADVVDRLSRFRDAVGGAFLAGIRHQVHDEADAAWLTRDDVVKGVAAVADAGLVYDLLVRAREMPAAVCIAQRLPECVFVLDHAGKPGIASGDWQPWAASVAELASLPNVVCKLSGLVTEADWVSWSVRDLHRYVDYLLGCFGPDRLMFGSDWPVCTLTAPYRAVVDAAGELVVGLSPAEQAMIFGGTAERVYRLA